MLLRLYARVKPHSLSTVDSSDIVDYSKLNLSLLVQPPTNANQSPNDPSSNANDRSFYLRFLQLD
jgi:hypothetical protein